MAHLGAIKGINNQTGKLLSEDEGRRGRMKKSERGGVQDEICPLYLSCSGPCNDFHVLSPNLKKYYIL